MSLPLGTIILFILAIIVYFGLGHRVLDRMGLKDREALYIIIALAVGSFIDIPISRGRIDFTLNVGGGIIPVVLAVYILSKAGTKKEKIRSMIGALVTGLSIFFIGSVLLKGNKEYGLLIDPIYIYPVVAGLTAYIIGRSRRAAFVSAILGVLILDIIHGIYLLYTGIPGTLHIGGAGAFDSIVLAGILAVLLAEFIGETRERLQGGPESKGRDPRLIKNLQDLKYETSLSINGIPEDEKSAKRGDNDE